MSDDGYHYEKDSDEKDIDKEIDRRSALEDIRRHVEKESRIVRRLDENNPHEQAKKFRKVKENPPDPDFMKVDLHQGENQKGIPRLYSRHIGLDDGREAWVEHDPFFTFSPYIGFMANIAKAPMNAMDVLFDETELVAVETKNAFKPEKRKDENNWTWILFVIFCVLGSVVGAIVLGMKFLGGG